MVRRKECLKRTLQIKISRPCQERRQVKRMVRRMWSSMRSARKPSRRLPRATRRSLGEEETFSLRGSRRAAQLRSSGRRRPVTMSALLLPLRQVTEGGVVEEEEEEGEVVVEGGVRRGEAEEEEGEEEVEVVEGGGGARMRKCWKDKLSPQSQFLSLTSLLIRFQTKEEILRGLPTAMAMMRKLNGGLLKQRQRAYGGTNLSLEPKKNKDSFRTMPEFPSLGGGVNDNDLSNGPTFTLGNERMANFHGMLTSSTS